MKNLHWLFILLMSLNATTQQEQFIWGVNIYPSTEQIDQAKELGVTWVRIEISWGAVESVVKNINLSPEQITDELAHNYAFKDETKNWKQFDAVFSRLKEQNIKPLVVIANGYKGSLPYFYDSANKKKKITPDNIGRKNYIALITLFAKATALRYKDNVDYWQIENELNVAGETVIWGWREGKAWLDFKFLTELLINLKDAIKSCDPVSYVCVNFHTGVPWWTRHVKAWQKHLDIIGIDVYPNYIFAKPVLGKEVGRKVKIAREIIADKKPVMVIETGYPSAPAYKGYSEQNQAIYVREAALSTREAGAKGFFYLTLRTSEEEKAVKVNPLFSFLADIEGYWGFIRKDCSYKPAWHEYKKIVDELK